MKRIITGNQAVAYGVMLSHVQMIAAYPITPQTTIVEELSELCATGRLGARFLKVESEHSAMAACIGASTAGVRAFTATSAQGLAYMHEMLHWASGGRLPIVLVNVNRALAPPWNIWNDQSDSLSQRDAGWIQLYCERNQEVLDTILQAYRLAETVYLPVMVVLDAFVLSHTSEPVDIPSGDKARGFLPEYCPPFSIDPGKPLSFSSIATADHYFEFRYKVHKAMEEVPAIATDADRQFKARFGRSYGLVERYGKEGAEVVLVTAGAMTSTSRTVVEKMAARGQSIGGVKLKMVRPLPSRQLGEAIRDAKKIVVIDRSLSCGVGGIIAQELRASLYHSDKRLPIFGFVAGLGGRDITPELIEEALEYALRHPWPQEDVLWLGLKK